MNHRKVTSIMASYILGDLDGEQKRLLEAHVEGCPSCMAELDRYQALASSLRKQPSLTLPESELAEITAAIRNLSRPSIPAETGWIVLSPMLVIGFLLFVLSNGFLLWLLAQPANEAITAGVWLIAGYQMTALAFFSLILYTRKSAGDYHQNGFNQSNSIYSGGLS